MPGLTGRELAQRVLDIRPGMPIIMCTGFSEEMTAEKARAQGINGFLLKPVLRADLAETIVRTLSPARQ